MSDDKQVVFQSYVYLSSYNTFNINILFILVYGWLSHEKECVSRSSPSITHAFFFHTDFTKAFGLIDSIFRRYVHFTTDYKKAKKRERRLGWIMPAHFSPDPPRNAQGAVEARIRHQDHIFTAQLPDRILCGS